MEVNYDAIKKANELIKPIRLSRKDKNSGKIVSKYYAEVNQRIKAFRSIYPKGKILSELTSESDGIITFRATIEDEEGHLLATAHARESVKSSYINESNAIENCETSAVGRALGMCGFGIDTSIASAEDLKKAMVDEQKDTDSPEEITKLLIDFQELIIATDTDPDTVYKNYKVKNNAEMSAKQLREAIAILKKKPIKNERREEIF